MKTRGAWLPAFVLISLSIVSAILAGTEGKVLPEPGKLLRPPINLSCTTPNRDTLIVSTNSRKDNSRVVETPFEDSGASYSSKGGEATLHIPAPRIPLAAHNYVLHYKDSYTFTGENRQKYVVDVEAVVPDKPKEGDTTTQFRINKRCETE